MDVLDIGLTSALIASVSGVVFLARLYLKDRRYWKSELDEAKTELRQTREMYWEREDTYLAKINKLLPLQYLLESSPKSGIYEKEGTTAIDDLVLEPVFSRNGIITTCLDMGEACYNIEINLLRGTYTLSVDGAE